MHCAKDFELVRDGKPGKGRLQGIRETDLHVGISSMWAWKVDVSMSLEASEEKRTQAKVVTLGLSSEARKTIIEDS